jgi:hypothetical protein
MRRAYETASDPGTGSKYLARVGFFVGRPRFVAREPGWYPVPEWLGPPQGWLPGYAPERAVVFRTNDAVLIAGRFDVYPSGAEFTLQLELRVPDDERTFMPWEFQDGFGRSSTTLRPCRNTGRTRTTKMTGSHKRSSDRSTTRPVAITTLPRPDVRDKLRSARNARDCLHAPRKRARPLR